MLARSTVAFVNLLLLPPALSKLFYERKTKKGGRMGWNCMSMAKNEQAFIAQNRRKPNSHKRKTRIGGRGSSTALPPPPQAVVDTTASLWC